MKPFDIIEHPADVGFLAYGVTASELFENAALAMCSLACAPEKIGEKTRCEVRVTADDLELLLYAWLAEILAIADADQLVFRRVEVRHLAEPHADAAGEVCGIAYGESFDGGRHAAGTYIKAVTMHQLLIERPPQGYSARVFLDL
jgi:SHS2 domain-containing protein